MKCWNGGLFGRFTRLTPGSLLVPSSLFCSLSPSRYHGSWALWRCTGVSSRFWITVTPTCHCTSTWAWSPRLRHWEVRGQPGTKWLPFPPSLCCLALRPTPSTSELCTLWGSVSETLYVYCTESADHMKRKAVWEGAGTGKEAKETINLLQSTLEPG